MYRENVLTIFISSLIHIINILDLIKRKKKQTIILTTFLLMYFVGMYIKLHMKNDMTFLKVLHSLPSNERRIYVWRKAVESLNNQTIYTENRNGSSNNNQTIHQLIENEIQRYKVRIWLISCL